MHYNICPKMSVELWKSYIVQVATSYYTIFWTFMLGKKNLSPVVFTQFVVFYVLKNTFLWNIFFRILRKSRWHIHILVTFPSHLKKITFYSEIYTRKVEFFSRQNFSIEISYSFYMPALNNNAFIDPNWKIN